MPPSLTGSESFRFRMQRSEGALAMLMAAAYSTMLAITIIRRVAGVCSS